MAELCPRHNSNNSELCHQSRVDECCNRGSRRSGRVRAEKPTGTHRHRFAHSPCRGVSHVRQFEQAKSNSNQVAAKEKLSPHRRVHSQLVQLFQRTHEHATARLELFQDRRGLHQVPHQLDSIQHSARRDRSGRDQTVF